MSFSKDLVDLKQQLQKLCHSKKCVEFSECPKTHEDCIKTLDIQTAMAWMLAYEISTFIEGYLLALKIGDIVKKDSIRGQIRVIDRNMIAVITFPQDVNWVDSLKYQWWRKEDLEELNASRAGNPCPQPKGGDVEWDVLVYAFTTICASFMAVLNGVKINI